jgi:excisionase family DNA binding protein
MAREGLSVKEACCFLGIKKTKLYSMLSSREIEAYHCGRRTLIKLSSIHNYIEKETCR